MTWSATQYTLFENERTRPVRDLLAAVPLGEAASAIDLGCGPGNSTQLLAERFPGAHVTGLDSAADMLAAARARLPGIAFERADISRWDPPQRYDVILANASLQWVPDHDSLYPRLAGRLAPGGCLAVQTPDNAREPAHLLLEEVAADERWAARLSGAKRLERHDAQWYYTLLKPHCARVDVWRTTYYHALAGGSAAVVEWFKGSSLRPFLDLLDAGQQALFLERYTAAIAQAYPPLADGTVLLPFPRLFLVASQH